MEEKTTVTMELTEEEAKTIKNIRRVNEINAYKKTVALFVLNMSLSYMHWLVGNGRGSTFSTFVDEFLNGTAEEGTVLDEIIKSNLLNELYNQVCSKIESAGNFSEFAVKNILRFKE